MDKIINIKNKKVHFLKDEHTTLCGMSDSGIAGFAKPVWQKTQAQVDCKLCLRKLENK